MPNFRKGDIVSIQGTVDSNYAVDGGKIKIRVEPYNDIYVQVDDLTMVRPSFEVGDLVAWETHDGADSWTGRILSIANDHLWCLLDADGSYSTVWASKARRVDPEPVSDEPSVEAA